MCVPNGLKTSEWSDSQSGYLCLSKGMMQVFRLLPLNLLRHFLEKGASAMKDLNLDGLKVILTPKDPPSEVCSPR